MRDDGQSVLGRGPEASPCGRVSIYQFEVVCGAVSRWSTWLSAEIICSGAGAPEAGTPLFGLLPEVLELAAMLVGEGGGTGEAKLQKVLAEEVLVAAIAVRVKVDVGEDTAVGVLRVADAGYLEPDDALREATLYASQWGGDDILLTLPDHVNPQDEFEDATGCSSS